MTSIPRFGTKDIDEPVLENDVPASLIRGRKSITSRNDADWNKGIVL